MSHLLCSVWSGGLLLLSRGFHCLYLSKKKRQLILFLLFINCNNELYLSVKSSSSGA